METEKQNSAVFFKSLKVIFFALLAGQIFFGSVALFITTINEGGFIESSEIGAYKNYIIFIVTFIAISAFSAGFFVFKRRLNSVNNITALSEKITAYRAALIIRYAIIECASFLAIVAFILTGVILLLAIAALIIVYFGTLIPSITRTIRDLELNPGDEQKLYDPNFLI